MFTKKYKTKIQNRKTEKTKTKTNTKFLYSSQYKNYFCKTISLCFNLMDLKNKNDFKI